MDQNKRRSNPKKIRILEKQKVFLELFEFEFDLHLQPDGLVGCFGAIKEPRRNLAFHRRGRHSFPARFEQFWTSLNKILHWCLISKIDGDGNNFTFLIKDLVNQCGFLWAVGGDFNIHN